MKTIANYVIKGMLRKELLLMSMLFNHTDKLYAQDSAKSDKSKSFNHVLFYDSSSAIRVIGNYVPGSLIKDGEWLYFYKDGKLALKGYFSRDLKRGKWVYYDENGKITEVDREHEKFDFTDYSPKALAAKGEKLEQVLTTVLRLMAGWGKHH